MAAIKLPRVGTPELFVLNCSFSVDSFMTLLGSFRTAEGTSMPGIRKVNTELSESLVNILSNQTTGCWL